MHLHIYLGGCHIVTETNILYALPYWTRRKLINPRITFKLKPRGARP
jgi:hypothetical protein